MRLVMALMVAMLHVGMPLGFCEKYMCDVARNAVPFFYMCSGFFIYRSHYGIVNGRIKSSLKKTIVFLAFTTLFYLVLELLLWQDFKGVLCKLSGILSVDTLFFNSTPFMPVGWYLAALIYSLLVVKVILKYFPKPNWFWWCIIVFCLFYSLLTGVYQKVMFENWQFSLKYNCCWISALPWLMIGMLISYYNGTRGCVLRNRWLLVAVVVGVLLCLVEHYVVKRITGVMVVGTLYFGTILSAPTLFVYLVQNRSFLWKVAPWGRKYSSNIYFYHVACNYVLCFVFGVRFDFPLGGGISLPFNYTILINCFSTSLLAAIVPLLINKISRKWN